MSGMGDVSWAAQMAGRAASEEQLLHGLEGGACEGPPTCPPLQTGSGRALGLAGWAKRGNAPLWNKEACDFRQPRKQMATLNRETSLLWGPPRGRLPHRGCYSVLTRDISPAFFGKEPRNEFLLKEGALNRRPERRGPGQRRVPIATNSVDPEIGEDGAGNKYRARFHIKQFLSKG